MQSAMSRCGLAGVAMRSPLSKFHTRRGALWINCVRSLLRGGRVFGASHSGLAGPPAAGCLRRPAFGAGRLWRPTLAGRCPASGGPPSAGQPPSAGRLRQPRMIFNDMIWKADGGRVRPVEARCKATTRTTPNSLPARGIYLRPLRQQTLLTDEDLPRTRPLRRAILASQQLGETVLFTSSST